MARPVRWGILGTGTIAHAFSAALRGMDARIAAVGSRRQESADSFGDAFAIGRRHASYEALVADPEVDVVYVATPNALHKDHVILCLKAGRAVLCEKPLAISADEGEAMVGCARERGLFLMEAMWTGFFPAIAKLEELLAAGAIGEPRLVTADFGFREEEVDPEQPLFDKALGGGALLDVGSYGLWLAALVLGEPTGLTSQAHLGETGVDEQSAVVMSYPGGALAILHTAIRTETPQEAVIAGTRGWIRLDAPWWRPARLRLKVHGADEQIFDLPYEGNGYAHEAREVMRCLHAHETESPRMPLAQSLSILRTMDSLRAQWAD